MDVRLLYPSLFLAALDFRGQDVTLTMRRIAVEELKTERGAEKKPVLYFEETNAKAVAAGTPDKEKRLVLCKTNAMTIASVHGFEMEAWPGKRVTLYPTQVQAFGKLMPCIRVRPTAPTNGASVGSADLAAAEASGGNG